MFSVWLLQTRGHGFFAPHGDEVPRAALGYGLRHGWDFPPGSIFLWWKIPGIFPHKVWPPLQFYLIALVYALTGDLFLSPFLVNCVCAAGILVLLYAVLRKILAGDPWLALAGTAVYAALPAIKAVDISGLDQTIVNFFLLAGIYFWMKAAAGKGPPRLLLPAAVAFLLAGAARFEGWFGVFLFDAYLVGVILFTRKPGWRRYALPALVISLLFIAIWTGWQLKTYGTVAYFTYHRSEALLGRDKLYLDRPLMEKIFFYPRLFWVSSPPVAIFSILGLAFFRRLTRPARYYAAFAVAEFLILSLSTLSVGVPHGAVRIIATNLLLCLPLALAGLKAVLDMIFRLFRHEMCRACGTSCDRTIQLLVADRRFGSSTIAAVLCLILAAFSAASVPGALHNSISGDIFRIGYALRWAAANGAIEPGERVYVEYTKGQIEREWDTQKISLFIPAYAVSSPPFQWTAPPERIAARLKRDRIVAAVVWSEGARVRLLEFMKETLTAGPYTVYKK